MVRLPQKQIASYVITFEEKKIIMAEENNSEMMCLNMIAIKCVYSMIKSNGGDGEKFNDVVGGICEYYGNKKVKVNQVLLITLDYDACGSILTMLF